MHTLLAQRIGLVFQVEFLNWPFAFHSLFQAKENLEKQYLLKSYLMFGMTKPKHQICTNMTLDLKKLSEPQISSICMTSNLVQNHY